MGRPVSAANGYVLVQIRGTNAPYMWQTINVWERKLPIITLKNSMKRAISTRGVDRPLPKKAKVETLHRIRTVVPMPQSIYAPHPPLAVNIVLPPGGRLAQKFPGRVHGAPGPSTASP